MSNLFSKLFVIITLLTAVGTVSAQQQVSVSGYVRDTSGAVVPNANVIILNPATNAQFNAVTNNDGVYNFPTLAPGNYRLTVEASGFEKKIIENLRLETAAKVTQNFELAVGNVNAQVVIEDGGITVNTTDAAVGTVINRRFVENIPLNGRSFQSLLTIVPGVSAVPSTGTGSSGGISVNGQRTESNYYTVDGVSANSGLPPSGTPGFGAGFSGSTPAETALGTTQSLISIDALQEFRAGTSTYSAEYGRGPGGQFSFTTRSGTNDYHGSLFNYFRNDVFDAANFFTNARNTPKPATRQNDFGGTFSGPLPFLNFGEGIPVFSSGKDRTFFFFSYEGLRLRTPQSGVETQVPSLALRASAVAAWKPLLNAFPVPNGREILDNNGRPIGLALYTTGYSNPSSIDAVSFRIDHRFSDKFSVFGRYGDTPSESTSRLLTNLAQTQTNELRNQTLTVGSTYLFNSTVANDFRFNYTRNKSFSIYETTNFGGAVPYNLPDIPTVSGSLNNRINVAFLFGGRPTFSLLNQTANQKQFNIVDTVSVVAGNHTLKFGVDYRQTSNALALPPRFMPINVASQNEFITNNLTNFNLVVYSLDKLRPVYKNFSAFVQDEWRVNSRLSLSLGLRYELNPAPIDANDNPPYTIDQIENLATTRLLTTRDQPLWKTTYNNFAPRLGVAYQLSNRSGWETVLRTGAGIYYDLGNTQASDGYGRAGFRTTTRFPNPSPFPLTQAQINAIQPPSVTTPYLETILTDDPNLKLPFTVQWSGAVEQSLGGNQTLTVSYVGASGQRLLIDRSYTPRGLGNLNFSTQAALVLTTNAGRSEYHALQTQFQRRLSRGFQANASYTWSHSIDNATSNFTITQLTRGDSDFDIRHNFQAALSYDIPFNYDNAFAAALLKNWAIDGRISARTALPVNIIGGTGVDPNIPYLTLNFQPNVKAGQPIYIDDATAPGGRRINYNAFETARNSSGGLTQGNLGRNALRGFGAFQTDLALRREFPINERFKVQFRAESFNIFNRANFGAINNVWSTDTASAASFGRANNTQNAQLGGLNSLYQIGGPRSFQFALKLLF